MQYVCVDSLLLLFGFLLVLLQFYFCNYCSFLDEICDIDSVVLVPAKHYGIPYPRLVSTDIISFVNVNIVIRSLVDFCLKCLCIIGLIGAI